ncbi:hypothetical protein JY651_27265 [Pyxidicoccus parkwayensis]|uniref:Lipoprotein n=1 Tax=Pyxidicoccus parkwayensis TaxID=2813578 RepID=A0ABX7NKV4_9BACT|nr:hypothetical protein [Pyxidicoccus parkwaysis]QSQ19048.1 hypothetical protein JY651_27265 [Pyxidicoccus parkwaysis]
MKNGVIGALLVSMLTACGGGLDADTGEQSTPQGEQTPESGEVTAFACSPYVYEFTYYSDCSRTQEVGFETLNCNGQRFLQGSKTRYYDAQISDLCAPCGTFPYSGTCQ